MDQTGQYLSGVTDAITSDITKWQAPLGFALIDFVRRRAATLLPMGNSATIDELVRAFYQGFFQAVTFRYWDKVKAM
jgi:hypothetical protein